MSSAGDYIAVQEDPYVDNQTLTPKLKTLEKTAVSMLELVEEKGKVYEYCCISKVPEQTL